MRAVTACVALASSLLAPAVNAGGAGAPAQTHEPIPITLVRAIQAALPKFEESGLEVEQYVVSVLQQESSYVVLFEPPNPAPHLRGSAPDAISFEVELDKQSLRILRSNFVR